MGICNKKKVVTGYSKSFGRVSSPYSSCRMDFQILLGQFEGVSKLLKLCRGAAVMTRKTTKIILPSTGAGMVVKMAPSLPIIPKIINTHSEKSLLCCPPVPRKLGARVVVPNQLNHGAYDPTHDANDASQVHSWHAPLT